MQVAMEAVKEPVEVMQGEVVLMLVEAVVGLEVVVLVHMEE